MWEGCARNWSKTVVFPIKRNFWSPKSCLLCALAIIFSSLPLFSSASKPFSVRLFAAAKKKKLKKVFSHQLTSLLKNLFLLPLDLVHGTTVVQTRGTVGCRLGFKHTHTHTHTHYLGHQNERHTQQTCVTNLGSDIGNESGKWWWRRRERRWWTGVTDIKWFSEKGLVMPKCLMRHRNCLINL